MKYLSTNNFTPIVQVQSFLTEYVTKVVYSVCSNLGPIARSMFTAIHWLRSMETYMFLW